MARHRSLPGALFALLLLAAVPCAAEVNQQAVAAVAAGKLQTARASWWGFDPTDATKCLQAAIDSKVPRLLVDYVGQPWVVLPLTLVSNQEIVFARGVEVRAKRGAYLGIGDALITGRLLEHVTLRGYGATLRMWRSDYDAAPYKRAESRHLLRLLGCSDLRIIGLTLTESGGDGLYLGTGQGGVPNKDVLVKDCLCDRNYRQGISVINAENLLIENTALINTGGASPSAGIDFEPNTPAERLVNCVMRNCRSENNAGCGYVAYLPQLKASSEPVGLRFENCLARGNGASSFSFTTGNTPDDAVRGAVELINCIMDGGKGPGFLLAGNPSTGLRVLLDRASIRDVALQQPASSPIMLMTNQGATQDFGGLRFVDCVIRDPLGRKPMRFMDTTGGRRVAEVSGNLILEKGGELTPVALTGQLLTEWMPPLELKRYPRYELAGRSFAPFTPTVPTGQYSLYDARLRYQGHWVLYAAAGTAVTLRVSYQQVGKYAGPPLPFTVQDWSGREITRVRLSFQQETEVKFTAPAEGLYQLASGPSVNYVQVVSSSSPVNVSAATEPLHFFGANRALYFYVPAGIEEFGVKVFGRDADDGVKATLYAPSGQPYGEQDDITQAHQFEVDLPVPSAGEIWRLKLSKASHVYLQDNYVELLGIPPFLATTPDAVLVPTN